MAAGEFNMMSIPAIDGFVGVSVRYKNVQAVECLVLNALVASLEHLKAFFVIRCDHCHPRCPAKIFR